LHRRKRRKAFGRTKAQPILDDSGNVEQYFAMIDATEKKLHEENTAQRKRNTVTLSQI
jgi:hypothetical protein